MIHATAKVLKHQQRRLFGGRISPPAVGEAVAIDLAEASLGSLMRIGHVFPHERFRILRLEQF
ncbi:hypothetical protein D3C86_2106460 [compost metagenome]